MGKGSDDGYVDGWLLKELVIKAGWHFGQDDAEMHGLCCRDQCLSQRDSDNPSRSKCIQEMYTK